MPYYAFDGITPVVHPDAYVHPTAVVIGDCHIAPGCYVAPNAVLRGDFGCLVLKRGSNLQDCCVVHSFPEQQTVIGEDGHIGHGAILHSCTIGRNALVGINAVVMDGAVVGESSIVAAHTFIKAGMEIPPCRLVIGSPAKVVRELTDEEMQAKARGTQEYQKLVVRSKASMEETRPLAEIEEGRQRLSTHLEPPHEKRERD